MARAMKNIFAMMCEGMKTFVTYPFAFSAAEPSVRPEVDLGRYFGMVGMRLSKSCELFAREHAHA